MYKNLVGYIFDKFGKIFTHILQVCVRCGKIVFSRIGPRSALSECGRKADVAKSLRYKK
jgi:hypothetical protein